MIEGDAELVNLVRVAFLLRRPICEVVRLPKWERDFWRVVFDVYGPLDWRRDDLRFAQLVALQIAERKPLEDLTIYPDPARLLEKERARQEMSKDDVLALFGVRDDETREDVH